MIDQNMPEGLTVRQESAAIALMNEPTVLRAAKAANVGERTLHTWLRQPAFAKAYRELRRESFNHAIALTQRYAAMAVNALAKICSDTSAPHAARVSAAVGLLRFGREAIELDDLAERLKALEAGVKEAEAQKSANAR